MFRVFNMGVGIIFAVDYTDSDNAMEILSATGENPAMIGEIFPGKHGIDFF